jgi:hypothetical protein
MGLRASWSTRRDQRTAPLPKVCNASAPRPHQAPMSTLRSSATARKLSRHTRLAEVRPDMPGTGVEQSTEKGKTGGRTPPRPGCPRPASRQRADHKPPYFPFFPAVTGIRQAGPEAEGASPSRPLTAPVPAWVTAGLPRRSLGMARGRKPGRGMCPREQRVPATGET